MSRTARSCVAPLAVLASVCSAVPSTAGAQTGGHSFLVGAGYTAPGGDVARSQQGGGHVQLGLEQRWTGSPFALRLEGMAYRLGGEYLTVAGERHRFGTQHVFAVGASALLRRPVGGIVPYAVSGAGYALETGQWPRRGVSLNAGVGVDVPLGRLAPFVEARFHALDPLSRETNGYGGPRWVVPITVGLRF